jgi:hypothetical protein
MNKDAIPLEVRRFLSEYVDSVEQLEILVFLERESERFCSALAVARALHLSEGSAILSLETLARRGLLDVRLSTDVVYRFSPATAPLSDEVRATVAAYRERRSALLAFVTSARRRSLKDFSDAFRFTKDPDDG